MRWDSLFDDLEAQFLADRALGREAEISERARVDIAGIELSDRLRGVAGAEIKVSLRDGSIIRGSVGHVGSEWLVLVEGGRQWLIPFAAVLSYQGLGRLARKPASRMTQSMGIATALRVLSRDRADLIVHLAISAGSGRDLRGVIDRVGRDHFDLAVVQQGEVRRVGSVTAVITVPFGSFTAICSVG